MGNFNVVACSDHPEHDAQPVPFRCHLRYCPDCEHDAQAIRIARYVPVLRQIAELGGLVDDPRPTWSLKKIELTTPFSLANRNAPALYLLAWKFFERWLQLLFTYLLVDELTPAEVRRGRVDLKRHGVGAMASVEFGERGLKLHFHILIYCPFIAKHKLTDLWSQASGGVCEITWIKQVDTDQVDGALREMVKYVTKLTTLPAELVPALALVLKGNRRLRTYGVFRGQPEPERLVCKCKICSNSVTLMRVADYFMACYEHGHTPDPKIAALAPSILLEFKPGNKAGEISNDGLHLARDDPDDSANQAWLPSFDALTKPFEYR